MANTKSAKKSALQSEARRQRNLGRRTAIKTAVKKVLLAIEGEGDASKVQELLKDVAAKLGRAKNKGILHSNTAARKLSRLSKKVAQSTKSAEGQEQSSRA
jgi:small subunit ribosomal protein S20